MKQRGILTALVVLGGCASLPYSQGSSDWDARLDRAEAEAFCTRWSALKSEGSTASAKARAELALEPWSLGVQEQVRCGTAPQIFAQGLEDARRLAQAAPDDPSTLRLLSAYQQRLGDARGATASSCRAAERLGGDATAWEECGDLRYGTGDTAGALAAWKSAVGVSADREQQFELIEKLEATSNQPSADLAALPPEVLDQYRRWSQQQKMDRQLRFAHD